MADKRERRVPHKLLDFEIDMSTLKEKTHRKSNKNKLWEVEKVLDRDDDKVLVKWKGFEDSENSWIHLENNPELSSYLEENADNPHSSTIAGEASESVGADERELWQVKVALFDELKFKRTPESDFGLVYRRVHVKVPFSKKAFSTIFSKGNFALAEERGLDFSGCRNIKFACTVIEIASVFGNDSVARRFEDSSTVCEMDPTAKVNVSWGYDLRINYDHSLCPRCTFTGREEARPSKCQPQQQRLPAMSYIQIGFKMRRRNMLNNKGN